MAHSHAKRQISEIAILQFSGYRVATITYIQFDQHKARLQGQCNLVQQTSKYSRVSNKLAHSSFEN